MGPQKKNCIFEFEKRNNQKGEIDTEASKIAQHTVKEYISIDII